MVLGDHTLNLHVSVEANPRPEIQLPPTGSGDVQYNSNGEETGYIRYTIHFERTMAMLRNNGMEPFTFNAAFEQVYDRFVGDQTGAVSPDGKGVDFKIRTAAVMRLIHPAFRQSGDIWPFHVQNLEADKFDQFHLQVRGVALIF